MKATALIGRRVKTDVLVGHVLNVLDYPPCKWNPKNFQYLEVRILAPIERIGDKTIIRMDEVTAIDEYCDEQTEAEEKAERKYNRNLEFRTKKHPETVGEEEEPERYWYVLDRKYFRVPGYTPPNLEDTPSAIEEKIVPQEFHQTR